MELSHLRALRELGERGSIAAVASALRVTPSSVSQQITTLQRHSPAPLTFKDGRRTALTEAGRALASAAIDVEVALARAEQAIARFQGDHSGTVTVAAFHSVGLAVFGPLIADATGPDPDLPDVSVSDWDVAQTEFPALTAAHDLVLAHRLVGSPAWPASVRVEPLLFEPLDIALRVDHPLASKASIDPADLRDEGWVAVHEGFPLEQAVTLIAGMGGGEPRIRHRVNDFGLAASVVSASGCIALMPRYTTDLHARAGLVLRPLARPDLGRHIDCLARPETLERANVKAVLSHVRSAVATLTGHASSSSA